MCSVGEFKYVDRNGRTLGPSSQRPERFERNPDEPKNFMNNLLIDQYNERNDKAASATYDFTKVPSNSFKGLKRTPSSDGKSGELYVDENNKHDEGFVTKFGTVTYTDPRTGKEKQELTSKRERKAGSSKFGDVQPVTPKRTADPRSSGSLKKSKNENRRASTILTGARGLLGSNASTSTTVLGG